MRLSSQRKQRGQRGVGCCLPRQLGPLATADPLWLGGQVLQGFRDRLLALGPFGHPQVDRCFMTCEVRKQRKHCRPPAPGGSCSAACVSREAVCVLPCVGGCVCHSGYVLGHTVSGWGRRGVILSGPGVIGVVEAPVKQLLRTPRSRCPANPPIPAAVLETQIGHLPGR